MALLGVGGVGGQGDTLQRSGGIGGFSPELFRRPGGPTMPTVSSSSPTTRLPTLNPQALNVGTQRLAAPGQRQLERGFQQAITGFSENPAVRARLRREALSGLGAGTGRLLASSRQAAQAERMPEFQAQTQAALQARSQQFQGQLADKQAELAQRAREFQKQAQFEIMERRGELSSEAAQQDFQRQMEAFNLQSDRELADFKSRSEFRPELTELEQLREDIERKELERTSRFAGKPRSAGGETFAQAQQRLEAFDPFGGGGGVQRPADVSFGATPQERAAVETRAIGELQTLAGGVIPQQLGEVF